MSQENSTINTGLIYKSAQYYAIIGAGIGILGIVLLNQLGGGGGIGGSIISGLLSFVVLSYAVLSGPIIAAFVGYIANQEVKGESRTRIINSAVANGVGYVVFGLVVGVLLVAGLSIAFGGGGASAGSGVASGGSGGISGGGGGGGGSSLSLSSILTLIALMMVPNALIGGAVTAVSNNTGSTRRVSQESVGSTEDSQQSVESQDTSQTSTSTEGNVGGLTQSIDKSSPVFAVGVSIILTLVITAPAAAEQITYIIYIAVFAPPLVGGAIAGRYKLSKSIPLLIGIGCIVSIFGTVIPLGVTEVTQDTLTAAVIVLIIQIIVAYVGFVVLKWVSSRGTEDKE